MFYGPTFVTNDPQLPHAEGLLVDNEGVILAVYPHLPDLAAFDAIRLPGDLALPGLHDAHAHLIPMGQRDDQLDLSDCRSADEMAARLRAFAGERPEAALLRGRGWDQTLFPHGDFPTLDVFAGLESRAVMLTRVDGHAALVS
ncbi:MAG: amidohydrolase family protein, partial [Myxococcota bacterium]